MCFTARPHRKEFICGFFSMDQLGWAGAGGVRLLKWPAASSAASFLFITSLSNSHPMFEMAVLLQTQPI